MSEPTGQLLERAVGGDADALTELLQHYGPAIEQTLHVNRKWRTALEPADVMQVTYFEAFMNIQNFDPARGSFEAWLRQIAHNNLRDAIRGLERQKCPQPDNRIDLGAATGSSTAPYELLGFTTTTPSRQAGRNELPEVLQGALKQLPADYAAVLRFYDLESRSIAEVAEKLGRAPGAVHMLRARAYDQLRRVLGTASAFLSRKA